MPQCSTVDGDGFVEVFGNDFERGEVDDRTRSGVSPDTGDDDAKHRHVFVLQEAERRLSVDKADLDQQLIEQPEFRGVVEQLPQQQCNKRRHDGGQVEDDAEAERTPRRLGKQQGKNDRHKETKPQHQRNVVEGIPDDFIEELLVEDVDEVVDADKLTAESLQQFIFIERHAGALTERYVAPDQHAEDRRHKEEPGDNGLADDVARRLHADDVKLHPSRAPCRLRSADVDDGPDEERGNGDEDDVGKDTNLRVVALVFDFEDGAIGDVLRRAEQFLGIVSPPVCLEGHGLDVLGQHRRPKRHPAFVPRHRARVVLHMIVDFDHLRIDLAVELVVAEFLEEMRADEIMHAVLDVDAGLLFPGGVSAGVLDVFPRLPLCLFAGLRVDAPHTGREVSPGRAALNAGQGGDIDEVEVDAFLLHVDEVFLLHRQVHHRNLAAGEHLMDFVDLRLSRRHVGAANLSALADLFVVEVEDRPVVHRDGRAQFKEVFVGEEILLLVPLVIDHANPRRPAQFLQVVERLDARFLGPGDLPLHGDFRDIGIAFGAEVEVLFLLHRDFLARLRAYLELADHVAARLPGKLHEEMEAVEEETDLTAPRFSAFNRLLRTCQPDSIPEHLLPRLRWLLGVEAGFEEEVLAVNQRFDTVNADQAVAFHFSRRLVEARDDGTQFAGDVNALLEVGILGHFRFDESLKRLEKSLVHQCLRLKDIIINNIGRRAAGERHQNTAGGDRLRHQQTRCAARGQFGMQAEEVLVEVGVDLVDDGDGAPIARRAAPEFEDLLTLAQCDLFGILDLSATEEQNPETRGRHKDGEADIEHLEHLEFALLLQ